MKPFALCVLLACMAFVLLSHAAPVAAPPAASAQRPEDAGRPDVRPFKQRKYTDLSSRLRGQLDKMTTAAQQKALDELSRVSLDGDDNGNRYNVHESGNVFVADDGLPQQPREPLTAAMFKDGDGSGRHRRMISGTSPTGYSSSGVPIHHSLPGSPNVIFLDFDGHNISGTWWNSAAKPLFRALPMDLDGLLGFSVLEQYSMSRIWSRVAEDYVGFNVDVTTEEPTTWTKTKGRCVITRSMDAVGVPMPSNTSGGVAYVNVFGGNSYVASASPAFVYYNTLAYSHSNIAEAASHEMGHNFGLSHDGQTAANPTGVAVGYYGGSGTGETSWGPIMGVSYGKSVSRFNPGDYPFANNMEDDLAVLATRLGYRPDDAGNSTTAATALAVSVNNGFAVDGIIERPGDVDCFALAAPSGLVQVWLTPYYSDAWPRGNNLDILATLFDAAGSVLATSDDSTTSSAQLSASVPAAGTVYVCLRGTGNAVTPYSSYGSMGQYSISGTVGSTPTSTTAVPTTNPELFPSFLPPSSCPYGCAAWGNLAADRCTRSQTSVDSKWSTGAAPSDAGRLCAKPVNDASAFPWCYCRNSNSSTWGTCKATVPAPSPTEVFPTFTVLASSCPQGCALWSNLASDNNTRTQSVVDAKWGSGIAPSNALRNCARPYYDQDTKPWCYCKNAYGTKWGYCAQAAAP